MGAAQRAEQVQLRGVLDALRDRRQTQVAAHAQDRLHDRPGAGVAEHRFDEAAVDLDQMDGELPEQAQRGVTGTEVVESDANTEVGQLAQFRRQCVARSDQGGLGDFRVEALRTQPGRRQRPVTSAAKPARASWLGETLTATQP